MEPPRHFQQFVDAGNAVFQPNSKVLDHNSDRVTLFLSLQSAGGTIRISLGDSPGQAFPMNTLGNFLNVTYTLERDGDIVKSAVWYTGGFPACVSWAEISIICGEPCECLE